MQNSLSDPVQVSIVPVARKGDYNYRLLEGALSFVRIRIKEGVTSNNLKFQA